MISSHGDEHQHKRKRNYGNNDNATKVALKQPRPSSIVIGHSAPVTHVPALHALVDHLPNAVNRAQLARVSKNFQAGVQPSLHVNAVKRSLLPKRHGINSWQTHVTKMNYNGSDEDINNEYYERKENVSRMVTNIMKRAVKEAAEKSHKQSILLGKHVKKHFNESHMHAAKRDAALINKVYSKLNRAIMVMKGHMLPGWVDPVTEKEINSPWSGSETATWTNLLIIVKVVDELLHSLTHEKVSYPNGWDSLVVYIDLLAADMKAAFEDVWNVGKLTLNPPKHDIRAYTRSWKGPVVSELKTYSDVSMAMKRNPPYSLPRANVVNVAQSQQAPLLYEAANYFVSHGSYVKQTLNELSDAIQKVQAVKLPWAGYLGCAHGANSTLEYLFEIIFCVMKLIDPRRIGTNRNRSAMDKADQLLRALPDGVKEWIKQVRDSNKPGVVPMVASKRRKELMGFIATLADHRL